MIQERLNKVEFICNAKDYPMVPINLDGYAIFSDSWICEMHTSLINERTGEEHAIINIDYYTKHEWLNPESIQYGAGIFLEKKRTAVKTETPLNLNDFYISK